MIKSEGEIRFQIKHSGMVDMGWQWISPVSLHIKIRPDENPEKDVNNSESCMALTV